MARTLVQVDNDLAVVEAQVKQLNGVGLTDPTTSTVSSLQKDINSNTVTIRQSILAMQAQIDTINKAIQSLTARLNSLGG